MGLGQYVYPRFAVHTTTGQAVPIERLRAHCLWYPANSLDGRKVSGHVLYISEPLNEAMEVALGFGPDSFEVDVERGEEGVAHRLTAPIHANRFTTVNKLIEAVLERTRQALPVTKRKLLTPLASVKPEDLLVRLEDILQKEGLHVLVPLSVRRRYQLFTDTTEALLPVSPLTLPRAPRLCFALLSTDDLVDKRDGSPWLRQAAELMVLPVNAVRVPQVLEFLADIPSLLPVLEDEHTLGELAMAMHEVTGGWPDLCDRFFERLLLLEDGNALRQYLRDLVILQRDAEEDPARFGPLLELALGKGAKLPELHEQGHGEAGDVLSALLARPSPFTWPAHGRGYLDGILGEDRGLAVPRSRLIEIGLRAHSRQKGTPSTVSQTRAVPRVVHPVLRWLHVSDLHFSQRSSATSNLVLESLLTTIEELWQRGRRAELIFVTGDIANTGAESEYHMAEAFLQRLCQAARVPRWALHMCPGNHDVDRARGMGLVRTLGDADTAFSFFQLPNPPHLQKMEAFRNFYNRFYAAEPQPGHPVRSAAPGQATAGGEIVTVGGVNLGVLPLNSAWFAQDDHDSGNLLLGETVLRAGLQQIQGATLRLALLHHPLSDLAHFERKLVQELIGERCHFLLRGHLHDTEAQGIDTGYKHLIALAAGAAYQGRHHHYQNRALYVEVEVDVTQRKAEVRPYPIRYELTGHDRWTLDTSVFPKSYPTYLETLPLFL